MALPVPRVTLRVVAVLLIAAVALAFVLLRLWDRGSPSATPVGANTTVVASGTPTTHATINTAATGTIVTSSTVSAAQLQQQEQLLACLRQNESGGNYAAVAPSGLYFGAYQFDQQTWNNTAQEAGYTSLVGIQPNDASPAQQDQVALALLQWQGTWPWNGDPCVG